MRCLLTRFHAFKFLAFLSPIVGLALTAGSIEITHDPYLQAPSESAVTICFATSEKAVSWVEYKPAGNERWLTNRPSSHGLVDADVTHHEVRLADLKPGTKYVYRVVSKEITDFQPYRVKFGSTTASPELSFVTLDSAAATCSFVVVSDRHDKADLLRASWRSVQWEGIDLAVLNGDMVNFVRDEQQLYSVVVDPCVEVFARKVPFIYVRGNHDTRGSFARRLMDYFPTESGQYYYSVQHGPVMFLILDCGEDKRDESIEYSGLVDFRPHMEREKQWLKSVISSPQFKRASFRVCLIHIPPSDTPDSEFVQTSWLWRNFVPLLNEGGLDLMISGHTHKDAVLPVGEGREFPVITGGPETVIRCDATLQELRVVNTDLRSNALPKLAPIKARNRMPAKE